MEIQRDLIQKFLDHPAFTPRHDTIIVAALEQLGNVRGRDRFLTLALSAEDEVSANYFQNVAEILRCDLKMEQKAIPDLRDAIHHCEQIRDYVTRELLDRILESEEEHVDWLETQLGLIGKMGIKNYTQLQSGTGD